MERFLKKVPNEARFSHQMTEDTNPNRAKQARIEINLEELPSDPGQRPKISSYHPNLQDQIRRYYLQKGPCQPQKHVFQQKKIGNVFRRFNPLWFEEYKNWLEYSLSKEACFCLCYLFKPDFGKQSGGDAFVLDGFTSWNKPERLRDHVGCHDSIHNKAWKKCEDLRKQEQSIQSVLQKQSDEARSAYRIRLSASVDCICFILRQGLAFRGRDESETSTNQGNFLELLKFLANHNPDVSKVALNNAPNNEKLTSHEIQCDIINATASLTTNAIVNDLRDELFAILVDESRDISTKEQMAVVLRYVNKDGMVIERFLGIVHISETSALTLKNALCDLLSRHNLSLSRLRGQGYDGASNMSGEFNGLKSLILGENGSTYYVHCFAHQLQLTLMGMAKKIISVASFFSIVTKLINVVGASCKRRDVFRLSQAENVAKALQSGELQSGRGLNQERGLQRPGDTRWSSHYGTVLCLIDQLSAIADVLEFIAEEGLDSDQRADANVLLGLVKSFDFFFTLHMMRDILGITNELCKALQRKDQDIVNAMELVQITKASLLEMRANGWDPLLAKVCSFCDKHDVTILNMDDMFLAPGRSARKARKVSNFHHYRVELFIVVLDIQLQELDNRFAETTTELLRCVACLNPDNLFSAFDKDKLICLVNFYPSDFSAVQLMALDSQLDTYIRDMRSNSDFQGIKGISALAKSMVQRGKHNVYPHVYLLVKLALILPVATASVERVFSAMNIVKNQLRNGMRDQLMNDCLITSIEKDVFDSISNEAILDYFQAMKTRRGHL